MEQRKVQQVGNSTYTVSLPKEWARAVDIEAGNVVTLRTHIDDRLVVQAADHTDDDGTLRFSIDAEEPTYLEQLVRATYGAGIERVEFTAEDGFSTAQKRAIQRVSENLCGLTIKSESATALTVETLLDSREVSVQQSVRQLMYVTLSAHEDAIAAVTGTRTADDPIPRDDHADRMYALVDRHFQRALVRLEEVDALGLTRRELFGCWRTARQLERIADHAERIATIAGEFYEPPPDTADRLSAIASRTHDIVESGVDTVLSDVDATTARAVLRDRDELRSEIRTVRETSFEDDSASPQLTRVLDSLERTAEHGGNIAEVGLGLRVSDESIIL